MKIPHYTKKFDRDFKLQRKCGKNLEKLNSILTLLVEETALPQKNADHSLAGNFSGLRECHVEPDWLLIYRYDGSLVIFIRTGTHSDIFG